MTDAEDPQAAAAAQQARRQNVEAVERHPVVSHDEWIEQRLALMEKEKQYIRAGDQLAAQVRALPWVKIETDYTFTSPQGDKLADLFKHHSQLLIKHFMMEPGQPWQCEGCSLESDHIDGLLPHFEHHDLAYVAVSRAPIDEIEAVRKRMGWKFCWGFVEQIRFQLRFPRVLPAGGSESRKDDLQLPRKEDRARDLYPARIQRVLQER